MINYSKNISEGHVSSDYNKFSTLAAFLIISQLYIIYSNTSSDIFQKKGTLNKVLLSSLYLLSVLFLMNISIIWIILKEFTTDGFC
jgi:predicted membrane channel-forming protein YqfA (hemolysin III family)